MAVTFKELIATLLLNYNNTISYQHLADIIYNLRKDLNINIKEYKFNELSKYLYDNGSIIRIKNEYLNDDDLSNLLNTYENIDIKNYINKNNNKTKKKII